MYPSMGSTIHVRPEESAQKLASELAADSCLKQIHSRIINQTWSKMDNLSDEIIAGKITS
jgi:hypothetical protein